MKENKETHKCCAEINWSGDKILAKLINHLPDEYCLNNAKYFENDKWYCGKHAPSQIEKREQKSFEKYKQWYEAQLKQRDGL